MCGIVAYIGTRGAQEILYEGLSRLEYRGYDSAGIAIVDAGKTHLRRAEGKLENLKKLMSKDALPNGKLGVGHTRWATHGRPSERNAHPHHYGSVTVVHNGIIENYLELKKELQQQGHSFLSDTDSEILAHLVVANLAPGTSTLEAFRKALKKVEGSYAIALINDDDPDAFYVARSGSPLVLGCGEGENFAASDVPALLPYTKQVIFLEDGELAQLSPKEIVIVDLAGNQVSRSPKKISWTLSMAEKEGYKHFMLKEIFEQPRALADTLRGKLQDIESEVSLPELEKLYPQANAWKELDKVYLLACGTSWHAALVARYSLEPWAKVLVQVEQASEFRYRRPIIDANTLVVAVSQSGETADTLSAVRNAKKCGAKILTITNVVDSSLARESHGVLYTHAGPEIGVAATKTFTTQILALQMFGIWLGRKRGGLSKEEADTLLHELREIPDKVAVLLREADGIKQVALEYAQADHCLFMGRGSQFPIALEGALKLKEISYLHAEGYSAGELKHGPIALIDKGTPLVAIALQDSYYDKMISNIQEVLARQASVIALVNDADTRLNEDVASILRIPPAHPALAPILTAIPLQLFAYYIADYKGHDVDQPRNLAKSVTVE